MHNVEGRICLITGASSGLGAHFARLFATAGARVILAARRKERVDELAADIRGHGGLAHSVVLDVTNEESVVAAYDSADAPFGPIDTVIANAGVSAPGRSTDISASAARMVFDTNLLGAFLTAREGAKRMIASGSRESGRGRILLIGSITAEQTGHGESVYAASKAAIAHLGRNLAREWVRQGVNVNVIQPGYIQTELAGDWFGSEGGKAQIAS
ncbi:MAG: SDR family NAD(P)-dependent oxidoreductase, partial [Novosphingobium sp.]|nr:SDR family NAD(P)-dependent oxidoreductase [Novosphingobium sp.]